MSDAAVRPPSPKLVSLVLFAWSAAFVAIGVAYHLKGKSWPWVAYALAAGVACIAWRARASGRWLEPLFAALSLLAGACVIGAAFAGEDLYAVVGILGLVLLAVGFAIAERLAELAHALRERPRA